MAKLDFSGLDSLVMEMQRKGELVGPVAEEMVNEGVKVIQNEWKLAAGRHGHIKTGAMVESIKPGPIHGLGGRAVFRDVYPHGKDSRGVRNAEKAFILHYGRANAPGDYWVDEAEQNAEPAVQTVCEEIWERFIASSGQ